MKYKIKLWLYVLVAATFCSNPLPCEGQTATTTVTTDNRCEYNSLLAELIQADGVGLQFEGMRSSYQQMILSVIQQSPKTDIKKLTDGQKEELAAKLTDRFLKEEYPKMLVDLIRPYYEKEMSLDMLKEYVERLRDEKVRTALQRSNQISKSIGQNKEFLEAVFAITSGKTPVPLSAKPCSDSYKEVFSSYYKLADI